MKFTLKWLKQHIQTDKNPEKIADILTKIGFEVNSITKLCDGFVVANVIDCIKHPNADKLSLCTVFDGQNKLQVVCGAPNVRQNIKAVLAKVGAVMPSGLVIKTSKIREYESQGMMCSAAELGIAQESDSIIELTEEYTVGQKFEIDPVFDIDVTPNRGDALCVYGIARDLSAAGAGVLKAPETPEVIADCRDDDAGFKVCIANIDKCKKFVGAYITGIQNTQSPDWICRFLSAVDIKPVCAVVDIANYLMLTYGIPIHVYDADKIDGKNLYVNCIRSTSTFDALDGKNYSLPLDTIVVQDRKSIQCVAGIIGAELSKVDLSTNNIFLECAVFDHISIAKTKRHMEISTDAAHRFERQVDAGFVQNAAKIATNIIIKLCGGECRDFVFASDKTQEKKILKFDPLFFTKLTGVNVDNDYMRDVLTRLGFIVDCNEKICDITVPTWRNDIETQNCIVEEILRIKGYQNLKNDCFTNGNFVLKNNSNTEKASNLMIAKGFKRVITWSFIDSKAHPNKTELLKIKNPIAKNLDVMRPTIAYSLFDVVQKNYKNSIENIKIFESGSVYDIEKEEKAFASLRSGNYQERNIYSAMRPVDFFDAKSDLLAVLQLLGLNCKQCSFDDKEVPVFYHPKRSAHVLIGDRKIGHLGELHPGITNGMHTAFFELFLDRLIFNHDDKKEHKLYKFPAVKRDFAFVFKKGIKLKDVKQSIKNTSSLVKSVDLFDVHKDEDLYPDMVSLAFSVVIQSQEQTLQSLQVQKISEGIILAVSEKFSAILRKDYINDV